MKNRVGIFELDQDLESREYWLSKMNLHILEARPSAERFTHHIMGMSPMFEEVPDGQPVPVYEVEFHPAANGVEDHIRVRRTDA